MNTERHDAILMEILQEKKTLFGFLQSVFGFLYRCTDFYHEIKSKDDNIGFPPGFKEKLVLQVIKQFEIQIEKSNHADLIPPVDKEVEVVTEEFVNEESTERKNEICLLQSEEQLKPTEANSKNNTVHYKAMPKFQPNEFYNGAKFDNYCWSQTINDLEIHIILAENAFSSKCLRVEIGPKTIKISNKKSNQIILEGNLYAKCKNNDAVWSISENKLQINLDKIKPTWWYKLLLNEISIDLSKMDCSRSLHDLPLEEQVAIEKLQWDHHQKMLGLPTSDDIKNHDILRSAWDADGSPFKGQPFDPSLVKFD